jgi:CHAD domain-containing protein
MAHMKWDERAGVAVNARRQLPALVTAYYKRVRGLLEDDPSAPKLHRARLATKRLRYTLELFRGCYGPGFETRMAELREVQQLLGEVNDCVAAGRHVPSLMKASPQRNRIEKFLDQRTEQTVAKFRKHWTEVFDAPGRELWWTAYLSRSRAPTKTARRPQ